MKLILVTDATGSMGNSCYSIKESMTEVKTIMRLLGIDVEVCLYRDYDNASRINCTQGGFKHVQSLSELSSFGGGGCPEAHKTAFNILLRENCNQNNKIVIHYTDAVPHGIHYALDDEGFKEVEFLRRNKFLFNWTYLCKKLKKNNFRVFTLFTHKNHPVFEKTYSELGEYFPIHNNVSTITSYTLNIIYSVIGHGSFVTPSLHIDLKEAVKNTTPEVVIDAFTYLTNVTHPNRILSLTTSPVLAKYWRHLCGVYQFEPRYATQTKHIMDNMSMLRTKLDSKSSKILKDWIDAAYDDTDCIRKLISTCKDTKTCLVLPLEFRGKISKDELLKLGRDCSFLEVGKLITYIQLVDGQNFKVPTDEDKCPEFVPMELDNKEIFRLLSTLVIPSIRFSPTAGILCAILSLTNKYLKIKAEEYLTEIKGTWIDWNIDKDGKLRSPLFWTVKFIRLCSMQQLDIFTKEEMTFINKYNTIVNINNNIKTTLEITTPLPIESGIRTGITMKRICGECNQPRCFTLFPISLPKCVACMYDDFTFIKEDKVSTNWVHCGTCKVAYSVMRPELLKCKPKCYYCRFNMKCPKIQCNICKTFYISDKKSTESGFTCPPCEKNRTSLIVSRSVLIKDLINENPLLKSLTPYDFDSLTQTGVKLRHRVAKSKDTLVVVPENPILFYKGYYIHFPKRCVEEIHSKLKSSKDTATCQICFESVHLYNLTDMCGNCDIRVCKSCFNQWYNQIEIGTLVSYTHSVCPFCKKLPVFNLIKKKPLAHVRNIRPKRGRVLCKWNLNELYALCKGCLNIKYYGDRECERGNPLVTNFTCVECIVNKSPHVSTKDCPSCAVKIEKVGGCNHMSCPCGVHWCWVCSGIYSQDSIYDHMANCGGIFPDEMS